MKLKVFNLTGKTNEEMDFAGIEADFRPSVQNIARYIRVYLTNQRQGTVSTKDRTTITGGGKKPWKQKGTGRARAGSNRSPLWVGGAIALGPKPKNWNLKVTKNMKYDAFKSALALMLKKDRVSVLDLNGLDKPATSKASKVASEVSKNEAILVIHNDDMINKSFRNIANVVTRHIDSVNTYDLASASYVLIQKEALNSLSSKI